MPAPERSLTTAEIADIIRVHPETARRYLASGRIPASKTSGTSGKWIVRPQDLDDYLTGRKARR